MLVYSTHAIMHDVQDERLEQLERIFKRKLRSCLCGTFLLSDGRAQSLPSNLVGSQDFYPGNSWHGWFGKCPSEVADEVSDLVRVCVAVLVAVGSFRCGSDPKHACLVMVAIYKCGRKVEGRGDRSVVVVLVDAVSSCVTGVNVCKIHVKQDTVNALHELAIFAMAV